jgi:hypothetical protein
MRSVPSVSTSWTHTATGNFVIVGFSSTSNNQTTSSQTYTCTYNGVAMTQLTRLEWDSGGSATATSVYYMFNPPKTAVTVAVSSGNGANTGRTIEGNSVSYSGVGGITLAGTSLGTTGGVATISNLSASGADKLFIVASGWGGLGSSTYTERANSYNGTFPQKKISLGDMSGTSTNASVTPNNNPYSTWGMIGARLLASDGFFGLYF